MKFVTVRDLREKSSDTWEALATQGELVLTSNGRPIAVLSSVSEDTLEEMLAAIRRARAELAVSEIQRQSVERGLDKLTIDEINREIAEVRRSKRRVDTN